jgi:hypothetical protein
MSRVAISKPPPSPCVAAAVSSRCVAAESEMDSATATCRHWLGEVLICTGEATSRRVGAPTIAIAREEPKLNGAVPRQMAENRGV